MFLPQPGHVGGPIPPRASTAPSGSVTPPDLPGGELARDIERQEMMWPQSLGFFEKKVSAATQRGPISREMRLGKTTPRLDISELAENLGSASALFERTSFQRTERSIS